MATSKVVDNLDLILSSTTGVSQFREFVCTLAVSGQITSNFKPTDSVTDLIESCSKYLPANSEMSELRFPIPAHWEWVPLASIAEHQLGKMLNTSKMKGITRPYLRSVNIRQNGTIDLSDVKEMLLPEEETSKYSVCKGDIFVNEGGDVGRSAIFNLEVATPLVFQNALHRLRTICGISGEYLNLVIKQAKYQGVIAAMSSGVTIQHFSASSIRKLAVPLPPLSEQMEIVKRVGEIASFCDFIQQHLETSHQLSTAARKSAVDAISTAQTQEDFNSSWERIRDNWGVIAGTSAGLDSIRNLVLSLAISGKLGGSSQSEYQHDSLLPKNWELKEFSDVANFSIGKTPSTKERKFWGGDDSIMWVSIGDMLNGGQIFETNRRVSPSAQSEIFRRSPWPSGTLLMSFKLTIGKVSRLAAPAFFNEAIFAFDSGNEVTNEFLFRVLPFVSQKADSKGAIKGNTLNSQSIRKMLIPLPPVDEQSRLIKVIDQLNEFCDELENQLSTKEILAEQFVRSLISESA